LSALLRDTDLTQKQLTLKLGYLERLGEVSIYQGQAKLNAVEPRPKKPRGRAAAKAKTTKASGRRHYAKHGPLVDLFSPRLQIKIGLPHRSVECRQMSAFSPPRMLIIVAFLAATTSATSLAQAQPVWIGSASGSGYLYVNTSWGNAVMLSNNVRGIPANQFLWTRQGALSGFHSITNVATGNCLTADFTSAAAPVVVEKPCTSPLGDDQLWQALIAPSNIPSWLPFPANVRDTRLIQNRAALAQGKGECVQAFFGLGKMSACGGPPYSHDLLWFGYPYW
jgi:hypothetical protein